MSPMLDCRSVEVVVGVDGSEPSKAALAGLSILDPET
jgi:hypothetical protein